MTLQNVIDEIGGNSEMYGSTSLADECLIETATPMGKCDGYEIWELECGDYFLSHLDGTTHLVLEDEIPDDTNESRAVRAVQAYREISEASRECCTDNGYGHQIVVWPDLSWTEAVSSNDITARRHDGGEGWEYPLLRIQAPLSAGEVRIQVETARLER